MKPLGTSGLAKEYLQTVLKAIISRVKENVTLLLENIYISCLQSAVLLKGIYMILFFLENYAGKLVMCSESMFL